MELHHGQTIERIIRRNGLNITELARLTNVSRRSVYNWFNQRHLKPEILNRIGAVIHHDSSAFFTFLDQNQELPMEGFIALTEVKEALQLNTGVDLWKDKYIDLLEKHSQLLLTYHECSLITAGE